MSVAIIFKAISPPWQEYLSYYSWGWRPDEKFPVCLLKAHETGPKLLNYMGFSFILCKLPCCITQTHWNQVAQIVLSFSRCQNSGKEGNFILPRLSVPLDSNDSNEINLARNFYPSPHFLPSYFFQGQILKAIFWVHNYLSCMHNLGS